MTGGLVSVVVPNFNGAHYLEPCLESVRAQVLDGAGLEVIVVDNGSTDGSRRMVGGRFPEARLITNEGNAGFTPAVNQGVEAARGEWILLLNNDAILTPGSLGQLLGHLEGSPADVAGVQPLLVRAGDEGVVDSAGIALGPRLSTRDSLMGRPVGLAPRGVTEIWGACAACVLLRREALARCGGLDPDFFAERDNVDFAFRARWHGYRFLLATDALVLHHRSATVDAGSTAAFIRGLRNNLLILMKDPPAPLGWRLLLYRAQRDLFMVPHHLQSRRMKAVLTAWRQALALGPRMAARRRELMAGARLPLRRCGPSWRASSGNRRRNESRTELRAGRPGLAKHRGAAPVSPRRGAGGAHLERAVVVDDGGDGRAALGGGTRVPRSALDPPPGQPGLRRLGIRSGDGEPGQRRGPAERRRRDPERSDAGAHPGLRPERPVCGHVPVAGRPGRIARRGEAAGLADGTAADPPQRAGPAAGRGRLPPLRLRGRRSRGFPSPALRRTRRLRPALRPSTGRTWISAAGRSSGDGSRFTCPGAGSATPARAPSGPRTTPR